MYPYIHIYSSIYSWVYLNRYNPTCQVIEENSKKFDFNVSVYMLELYNEKLLDLLIDSETGTAGEGKYDIKKDKKGMGGFLY